MVKDIHMAGLQLCLWWQTFLLRNLIPVTRIAFLSRFCVTRDPSPRIGVVVWNIFQKITVRLLLSRLITPAPANTGEPLEQSGELLEKVSKFYQNCEKLPYLNRYGPGWTEVGGCWGPWWPRGGSRDDPGGSQLISRDDPTVTEGGASRVFRAANITFVKFLVHVKVCTSAPPL